VSISKSVVTIKPHDKLQPTMGMTMQSTHSNSNTDLLTTRDRTAYN